MNVRPISDPLHAEQVVGVWPTMSPRVEAGWRRRLHLFTGRSLSDTALRLEQTGRAGHLALVGQRVSPGVVRGLEVGLERRESGSFLHLGAGFAISASGEDVVVPQALRIPLDELWMYLTQTPSPPPGEPPPAEPPRLPVEPPRDDQPRLPVEPPRIDPPRLPDPILSPVVTAPSPGATLEELAARIVVPDPELLRPTGVHLPQITVSAASPLLPPPVAAPNLRGPLRDLREKGTPLPDVAILLLEPVEAEIHGDPGSADPCEQDPRNDAFADWQIADGCRLVLYAWPWPDLLPERGPAWRNEVAYTLFQMETALPPGKHHPWERIGVPIGLVGFDVRGAAEFVDTHAVVREGGKPRRRSALLEGVGSPFLWQARMQQFAEQLAEVDWESAEPAEEFGRLRYFPPAGLLPRRALELDPLRCPAFPDSYLVDAVPIPLEQLDAALEASAGLEPFDTRERDRVRLLVPVPQGFYEPGLLEQEEVGPEFQDAIDRATETRDDSLRRREDVRRRAEAVVAGLSGRWSPHPDPAADPDRLEEETVGGEPPFTFPLVHLSELAEGMRQHFFNGARDRLPVESGDILFAEIFLDPENPPREAMLRWYDGSAEHRAFWGDDMITDGAPETHRQIEAELPPTGEWVRLEVPAADVGLEGSELSGISFTLFDGRAVWGRAGKRTAGGEETAWVNEGLPEGARAGAENERWSWVRLDLEQELDPPEESFDSEVDSLGLRRADRLRRLREELEEGPLHAEEVGQLERLGLKPFIEYLDARIRKANDKIDFGFLRVQADMYRLRQLMVGEAAASRLATSPALASIIKGESAVTVRENLLKYLDSVKFKPPAELKEELAEELQEGMTDEIAEEGPGAGGSLGGEIVGPSDFLAGTLDKSISTQFFGSFKTLEPITSIKPVTQEVTPIRTLEVQPSLTRVAIQDSLAVQPVLQTFQPSLQHEVWLRSPIVGESYDFRTVTVGERLSVPPANEARSFTVLTRYETIRSLSELEINLGDIRVPGLLKLDEEDRPVPDSKTGLPQRESRRLEELTPELMATLILGEPQPPDADEAAFFSVGVQLLDHTISTLRNAEGRIQEYRGALAACHAAHEELAGGIRATDRRLKELEDRLAEARHDLAVARALLGDEELRVEEVNERRSRILREHVLFLAYQRPRLSHADLEAPVRELNPAFVQSPVPACLADEADAPPELRTMVGLLREAPIRWFTRLPELLDSLDRMDVLVGTVRMAKARAQTRAAPEEMETAGRGGDSLLGQTIGRALAAQQRVVTQHRVETARADIGRFRALSWRTARVQAERILSLGDLIDATHGRTRVDRGATGELDDILRVATCLYARFGEVLPAIRLQWAERLSQHDRAADLRNLYSLPRWGSIDYLSRREMQTLVDWLYGRIDLRQAEAVRVMNDLVRVCLLLASHAPVNRILAGSVSRQATARVGGTFELAVDLSRVRVGMHVLVHDQDRRPVHAVVEDLADGVAVGRVVHAARESVTIAQGARAQFGESARATAALMPRAGGR